MLDKEGRTAEAETLLLPAFFCDPVRRPGMRGAKGRGRLVIGYGAGRRCGGRGGW